MAAITFKPKQVTKRLLSDLPDRAREVLTRRYGLGTDTEHATLEAIGKEYGITRERVRQIENYGVAAIRKSEAYKAEAAAFAELAAVIDTQGGMVSEEDFLKEVAKDQSTQNHIHFLLVVGEAFTKEKENEEFRHRWHTDRDLAESVHQSLRKMYEHLSDEDLIPESELISTFLREIQHLNERYKNEEIVRRWLTLSKRIGKNPLGEWGKAESPNVRAKGMRDFAYLVIKRHGSPMHFREVAQTIQKLFSRKAHEATCHNELIKDGRFVLVGRGIYALQEWGYVSGVVKDVIGEILRQSGPLTKEEIIDKVRKERYVKDNTIVVNLQDTRIFNRDDAGRYSLK
jgi:Sigma-70, region 4/HB1, ASXL, restriction endonuclease HTH domain